ncbi:enoyl-CoA hydratase-related protein [Parapedobacter lycopersici]|uniref:enoyl-CoA hydratase/isomerase family protein n=1 Tax=Parapedobacter lycopersici TaxID=1864939 RepID=UPI00333E3520
MAFHQLLIRDEQSVRFITINREEKLNALNQTILAELHGALTEALADNRVRGIVLTGAGKKAFVAGADIAEFAAFDAAQGLRLARDGHRNVFDLIHHAGKPILAAINGYALGGGLELALACHLRIAVPNARLGLPEVTLGLIPGYGGTQRLTQLVGRGRALELILTADMITAEKALEYGLVNVVVDQSVLLEKALEILQTIASRSPNAVAAAIRAVNAGLDPSKNGFEVEIEEFSKCFGTADFAEGVSAFLAKRKPNF